MTFGKKKGGHTDISNNNDSKGISKKGILLTCVMVGAILATSFVVWLLPNENVPNRGTSNMTITFKDPNATLVSTKSQFLLLQSEVQNQINGTVPINKTYFNTFIDTSISLNNDLMLTLLNGNPDQSIMPDYLKLMNEMRNYSQYLNNLKNISSN